MIYSKERRAEVLAECDAGKGTREVALMFMVSESWVRRIKQERREQGKVAPKLTRNRVPAWAMHADWLREKVAAKLLPPLWIPLRITVVRSNQARPESWMSPFVLSSLGKLDVPIRLDIRPHRLEQPQWVHLFVTLTSDRQRTC